MTLGQRQDVLQTSQLLNMVGSLYFIVTGLLLLVVQRVNPHLIAGSKIGLVVISVDLVNRTFLRLLHSL